MRIDTYEITNQRCEGCGQKLIAPNGSVELVCRGCDLDAEDMPDFDPNSCIS